MKVVEKEFFPADLLILCTSEPKGLCYIETKNLDGETNLKQRKAHVELQNFFKDPDTTNFTEKGVLFTYEKPNATIGKFNGNIQLPPVGSPTFSIDNSHILLRGCSLQNSSWIYGLVCYTGHDSKIMMNLFKARAKKSHIEYIMGI